jgi:hypothetical protein
MTKSEMKWYGGNLDDKLGLKIILYATEFTSTNAVGMSLDPVLNDTDLSYSKTQSGKSNPGLLVSTTLCSPAALILPFLVHNGTINVEHKVKSFRSIPRYHDHVLARSIIYTEYSKHRVQHPPINGCHPFIFMIMS